MSSSSSEEESADEEFFIRRRPTFRERIDWTEFSDSIFYERFRLSRAQADQLLNLIGPDLEPIKFTNHALNAAQKLLIGLRFLSTGDFYYSLGDSEHVSKSTALRCIRSFRAAVIRNVSHFICWPENEDSARQIAAKFFQKSGMVLCVGALDGSLIEIKTPFENEEQFVSGRKPGHYINMQACAGPDLEFLSVSVNNPGRVNDARVLRRSALYRKFQNEIDRPFPGCLLVADYQYPFKSWLIPTRHPGAEFQEFYRAHSRARRLVENSFALLKNRFNCLKRPLRFDRIFDSACIIKCATILHNFCLKTKAPDDFNFYPPEEEPNDEADEIPNEIVEEAFLPRLNQINNVFLGANNLLNLNPQ